MNLYTVRLTAAVVDDDHDEADEEAMRFSVPAESPRHAEDTANDLAIEKLRAIYGDVPVLVHFINTTLEQENV